MKYFNTKKLKPLPNRKVDKFLLQLEQLFKNHKMMMIRKDKRGSIIEPYDVKQMRALYRFIQDSTDVTVEEDDIDEKPTKPE